MNGVTSLNKQRLDKTISSQGLWSRKDAKTLIRKGLVCINGSVVKSADAYVDWDSDTVTVEGEPLSLQQHVYLMLNKPKGVVSATEDKEQTTVVDLVPDALMRKGLFPAGRLDKDTTGLLILTDDGDFAHEILSPKKHVQKVYLAKVNGSITDEIIESFRTGVNVHNEYTTLPSKLTVVSREEDGDWGKVILREGMYHQIKRMFGALDNKIIYLERITFGPLTLDGSLKRGEWRYLTEDEIKELKEHKRKFNGA